MVQKYLQEHAQLCPKCGRYVEKEANTCDHMHCDPAYKGCGAYFCYGCGVILPSTYKEHIVYDEEKETYVCPSAKALPAGLAMLGAPR